MKFSFNIKITLLFFVCLLLRFFFAGKYLENEDSINFALGLHDYDISLLQPHFPGYPVYIFISSLFFKLFHNDVTALVMPGVLFGSLTIFPLSFISRRLFTEETTILAAILYVINPLCWLQSERPASDATGLFFIMLSAQFLFSAFSIAGCGTCTPHYKKLNPASQSFPFEKKEAASYGGYCLFLGSLFLGISLGARLSYFPFVFLWMGVLLYYAFYRIHLETNCIFSGFSGLFFGIGLWFIPQLYCTGINQFFHHALFFTRGHFTDWGGSALTFGGWGRAVCLMQSFWEYGLGACRHNYRYSRDIPPMILLFSLSFAFRYFPSGSKRFFCILYAIPYTLWIAFGQNVANSRHLLPLLPVIILSAAWGLMKIYEILGKKLFLMLVATLIVTTSLHSFTMVIQYHCHVPSSIQLLRHIETHYKNTSVRIYCCPGEKRLLKYYLPQWDIREAKNVSDIHFDLQSSLMNPETILVVQTGKNTVLPDKQFSLKITFESFPHTTTCLNENILLYQFDN